MAEYLTLTEFVPGTKAKAQEVNANFTALKDAVNLKADLAGSNIQTFSIADATEDEHAVNKKQLDDLSENADASIRALLGRFTLVSGNLSDGYADLLSYSGTTLSFKIGGTYDSLKWISANGSEEEVTSLASITGLSTDGTFNIIKELDSATAIATSSSVTIGKVFPDSPSDGDYHCLNSLELETYKRVSGEWVETQYIKIGTVTVDDNVVSDVETTQYGQNDYHINSRTQGYRFPDFANGISKSLNTIYQAECDGWISVDAGCNQGSGLALNFSTDSSMSSYYETWGIAANVGYTKSRGLVPILKGLYYQTGGFGTYFESELIFYPAKGV